MPFKVTLEDLVSQAQELAESGVRDQWLTQTSVLLRRTQPTCL